MMRLILAALAGAAAGLIEVAVVPFVPAWAGARPLLPLAALLIVSTTRSRVAVAALAGAAVLEAYSLASSDLPFLRILIVVACMDVLARRFLTNRSVYATVALAWCGRLFEWASAWLVSGLLFWLGVSDAPWTLPDLPFWAALWDGVLVATGFFCLAAFSGRFLSLANPASRQSQRL